MDIGAIAVDPRGRFAATGEVAPRARVHIWDAVTGNSVSKLAYLHRKGVARMSAERWWCCLPKVPGDFSPSHSGAWLYFVLCLFVCLSVHVSWSLCGVERYPLLLRPLRGGGGA